VIARFEKRGYNMYVGLGIGLVVGAMLSTVFGSIPG